MFKSGAIVYGIIFIIFITITTFISFNNRIEGDAAFHALVSREISEKQHLIGTTSYILANANTNYPVAYPQLFHLTGAMLYSLIGDNSFQLLPVIYGTLALIFLTLIFKSVTNYFVGIILSIITLAFNTFYIDYSSKYFMEIALVSTTVIAVYCSVKYMQFKNRTYLYLTSLFCGLALALKQQGIVLLPMLIAVLFNALFYFRSFRYPITNMILFIAVIAGPLAFLFSATGSILYAGDNAPKIVELIESPLRNYFQIQPIRGDEAWSVLNEGRRSAELAQWRNFSNISTAWIQNGSSVFPWGTLTTIILIAIIFNILFKKNTKELPLLLFLLSFIALMYYLARPRYALPLIILPSLVLFYFFIFLKKINISPLAIIMLVVFLIHNLTINFTEEINGYIYRDHYGYLGKYIENRDFYLSDLYNFMKNDQSDFSILTPVTYETSYYTKHKSVWSNPYGSSLIYKSLISSDEKTFLAISRQVNAKYLLVYYDRYMPYSNWAGITPSNGLLEDLNDKNFLTNVKTNQTGSIYMLNY